MKQKTKRILLIFLILLVAIGIASVLGQMKPPPEKKDEPVLDPLVEVQSLETESVTFVIESQGTVRPRTRTELSAEVSGTIVEVSPRFVAGGLFSAGETLLRIDPETYEAALTQAEALLAQRRIEVEGARKLRSQGYRAESELAAAEAALATARAEQVRARRNLERSRVSLPYDGLVMSRAADVGQFVNPGTPLGVTFATDYAEVRLPLSDADQAFLDLPGPMAGDESPAGPQVTLHASRRGENRSWQARISRTEGVVDEQTRVSFAVARIDDPYALQAGREGEPILPVGSFVTARIQGTTVSDIIRIPRRTLRPNQQVVIADAENRLRLQKVRVLRADQQWAYVTGGVAPGDRLVLTTLENPINGMAVRIEEDATPAVAAGSG